MFSTKGGASKLALAAVLGLVTLKVVVAAITGSISITAQAVDSFLDLFAIGVTLFAVRISSTPADEGHPFGHGKVEGIAAWVQAGLIFIAGSSIAYSAMLRIMKGAEVELTEAGIGVMLVSVIVSILLSRHLLKVSRIESSLALEGLARNIAADVYSAAGVLISLVILRFTKFNIIDPIVAIGVAVFILKSGFDILRKSFAELVDVRLPREEEDEVISCITAYKDQIAGFHAVRTRKAGSQRFIDLHLVMPKDVSLEKAHELCDRLEVEIETKLHESSVTIHVEPCDEDCEECLVLSCSLRKA